MKLAGIQAKLFMNYSLLIIGVVIVIVVSFYFYISDILQKKASETLFQLSGHIISEFDSQFRSMNEVSTKILYSEPLRKLFYSDMFDNSKSSIDRQRQFNDFIYPIIGYNKTVKAIRMFRLTGEFASIGDDSLFSTVPASRIAIVPWVADTILLGGRRHISLPRPDSWTFDDALVISLSRVFPPAWGMEPDSILEVQQDYQVFENIIMNTQGSPGTETNRDVQIYVFNGQGALAYPLSQDIDPEQAQAYREIINSRLEHDSAAVISARESPNNIIAFSTSEVSNWTVVAVESKGALLEPIIALRNAVIVLGILTLFVTLAISYLVSRSLTIPIKKIYKSVKLLSLDTLSPKSNVDKPSRLNELEHLNLAFTDMRLRLQQSLEETIALRAHELEAHNFALQAQMNPHFLYNTITNISILAEEQGQQSIVQWCERLSHMLRYISSRDAVPVLLSEELEHTSHYLNLMQLRYENNLQFVIEIPDELRNIKVPKLIVQPIVENIMKYGIHVDPPWIVKIIGIIHEDRWELVIRDNGHGFDEKRIHQLKQQFAITDPAVKLPALRIDGMGLLNIYSRLKLVYGNRFALRLENHPDGGAMVTIVIYNETGGQLNERFKI